jgi:hypothetical protein
MNRCDCQPAPAGLRRSRRRAGGFTLIEAALTTVIVGTGVLAIVAAQQAYHAQNGWAQRTSTAMMLANELRELTMTLPLVDPIDGSIEPRPNELTVKQFNDLGDFAGPLDTGGVGPGMSFSAADGTGPINALREVIQDMPGWRQHIRVEAVQRHHISVSPSANVTPLTTVPLEMVRVTVQVWYQGSSMPSEELVTELSWIVTRR